MKNKSIRMVISLALNLILIVLGVFIIFTAGSKAYSFGHNIFDEEAIDTKGNGRDVEVSITDGITPSQLSKILYDKGLVEDKTICSYQIKLSDYKGKFVGGTYTLNTDITPTDMMKVLTKTEDDK